MPVRSNGPAVSPCCARACRPRRRRDAGRPSRHPRPLARLRRLAAGNGSVSDAAEADWTLESRLDAALDAVDLPLEPDRPLATLSGGQRTRAALAALLLAEPDLVLLDEPTNNLDADGRAAVARVLSGWKKGAVVVSHDRALLRPMDRIVELSDLGARIYGGGYDL